jgi:hypothetical protein
MPEPCCYRGHDLTADRARLPNGKCRLCDKINQKNYQRRVKIGTALLHAVEDRGLSVGEALALVEHAPYWILQECQTEARRAPAS